MAPRRSLVFVLASALLMAAVMGPSALAATSKKPYGADVGPHFVLAGATDTYTFGLTNESKTQSIGSANLTAPSGFSINSIGIPSQGTATLAGNTIKLRNLNLQPGRTVTLAFTATAASSPGSYLWTLVVRQANDFRGTGNFFSPDPDNVHLTTTVIGGVGGVIVACEANASCSGTATDGTTTAEVQVDPGATPTVLTVTLLPDDPITCQAGEGTYQGTSATVDFNITSTDRTKTVTLTIDSSLVGDRSASDFQVCYSSNMPFTDRFGNPIPVGSAGLLPDCAFEGDPVPPCVLDRVSNEDGSVSVRFFAPEGDPKGRL
jgi:hypothetical protein